MDDRPSSWPVRSSRRHHAVVQFNNQVLDLLSDISARMKNIENQMVQSSPACPPGLRTARQEIELPHGIPDEESTLNLLARRMDSVETLLFRASFADFNKIDHIVERAQRVDSELDERALAETKPGLALVKTAAPIFDMAADDHDCFPDTPPFPFPVLVKKTHEAEEVDVCENEDVASDDIDGDIHSRVLEHGDAGGSTKHCADCNEEYDTIGVQREENKKCSRMVLSTTSTSFDRRFDERQAQIENRFKELQEMVNCTSEQPG